MAAADGYDSAGAIEGMKGGGGGNPPRQVTHKSLRVGCGVPTPEVEGGGHTSGAVLDRREYCGDSEVLSHFLQELLEKEIRVRQTESLDEWSWEKK